MKAKSEFPHQTQKPREEFDYAVGGFGRPVWPIRKPGLDPERVMRCLRSTASCQEEGRMIERGEWRWAEVCPPEPPLLQPPAHRSRGRRAVFTRVLCPEEMPSWRGDWKGGMAGIWIWPVIPNVPQTGRIDWGASDLTTKCRRG